MRCYIFVWDILLLPINKSEWAEKNIVVWQKNILTVSSIFYIMS